IAQASRANDPDAALSLWQEAHTLLMRGEFLADDLDAEWSNARWVKGRRHGLWLARCRLMRHLADAYVERGQLTLAEETLEQHLTRYPTNQDALYRLMLLLEQQGCHEPACIMYERAKRSLDEQGKKPTNQLKMLYERVQQAVLPVYPALLTMPGEAGLAAAEKNGRSSSFPIAIAETPRILQDITVIERARPSEGLPSSASDSWEEEEILAPFHNLFQKVEGIPAISRRHLLKVGIATIIGEILLLDRTHISAVEREELGWSFGESVAASWKLFHTSSNAEVLTVGNVQLCLIHQAHALIYPSALPYLYTGVYGLIGIGLHFRNATRKLCRCIIMGTWRRWQLAIRGILLLT
ncbi:MAG: bacterial transcriptional activator domain-containing protein, partial [Ktedonobacteraceae bacterium]